jgi:hypothetical protein
MSPVRVRSPALFFFPPISGIDPTFSAVASSATLSSLFVCDIVAGLRPQISIARS